MENSFLPNDAEHSGVEYPVPNITKIKKIIFYVISLVVLFSLFYFLFLSAPSDFPSKAILKIEPGMSLRSISSILKREHIIRSKVAFESFIIIFGEEKHVVSANYLFEEKMPVWQIAKRIGGGEHYMAQVVITIPEGFDINQISDVATLELANFNKVKFLLKAKELEGYLFPDTYFFLNDTNETEVINRMNDNFKKKIASVSQDIISSGKTEKEIITMASIIEKESKGDIDRGIISGILWKRISVGMPLQVDSAPETYKTKGLPKNPIGNPGLEAIKSAIYPQNSPYLYYLHDQNGGIHYAKNFSEHIKNKLKYLK